MTLLSKLICNSLNSRVQYRYIINWLAEEVPIIVFLTMIHNLLQFGKTDNA